MTSHGDGEKPESSKNSIMSNRLEDIVQYSNGIGQRVVVTSATYPYHVEWINSEWSKACGWRSDEILGLDCKFLQGDVTDQKKVSNFMTKLFSTGGFSDLKVLNYHKDNTLLQNSIRCFPVIDNCGPDFSAQVSHIAAVLVQTKEFTLSEEDMGLMEDWHLKEVGMPIDRREGCNIYPHCNSLPPPSALEWQVLTENLPLALMLRYMLRSQAPIVLTDREDRIVHVNVSWVNLTGYSGVLCEGKVLSTLFHDTTDDKALQTYNFLVDKCKKIKTSYSDDNVALFSAYSTDSESSEDTQFVATPRIASIILSPPSSSSTATISGSFQLNPWGSSKASLRPRMQLSVSPAAIKAKHMAYLFSDVLPSRTDKMQKTESMDSPITRKRPKSASVQGMFGAGSPPTQNNSPPRPVKEASSNQSSTSSFPFGTSTTERNSGTGVRPSHAVSSSSNESSRKLLKCSSLPPQSSGSTFILSASLIRPSCPSSQEIVAAPVANGETEIHNGPHPPTTNTNFINNMET